MGQPRERQARILEKHKQRLLKAMHDIFDSKSESELGMEKEEVFELIEESIDHTSKEFIVVRDIIPEYYTLFQEFTVYLAFRLDKFMDIGMPQEVGKTIMELVNSYRDEAYAEQGLEGKVEAVKSVNPKIELDELHIPEGFRK